MILEVPVRKYRRRCSSLFLVALLVLTLQPPNVCAELFKFFLKSDSNNQQDKHDWNPTNYLVQHSSPSHAIGSPAAIAKAISDKSLGIPTLSFTFLASIASQTMIPAAKSLYVATHEGDKAKALGLAFWLAAAFGFWSAVLKVVFRFTTFLETNWLERPSDIDAMRFFASLACFIAILCKENPQEWVIASAQQTKEAYDGIRRGEKMGFLSFLGQLDQGLRMASLACITLNFFKMLMTK